MKNTIKNIKEIKLNTVINTTKKAITNANKFALVNTEELVIGTFDATKQWQDVTANALKGGLKLMENQQNIVFNTLESFKSQLIDGKNKFSKIFA